MKSMRGALRLFTTLTTLTLVSLVIINRQSVYDWYALRGYEPTETVKLLAQKSAMTKSATNIFYVYKPSLLDKNSFNQNCPIGEETIVLGCYDGKGIYILDINDPRLSGIEEVTAAHEMLHAAYARLSEKEKIYVNKLIEVQLTQVKDERILKNIQSYRDKDPSTVINEAHSILATEVRNLSPELESYYSRFFINRKAVVDLSEAYESIFTNIKVEVTNLDNQLSTKKEIILTKESELTLAAEKIINWSNELENIKKDGKIVQYNSQVDSYNASVDKYRNDVAYVKSLIAEYNTLIEKRNQLATQQSELYKSIDSKVRDL